MMTIRILRGLTGKRLRWIHASGTTEHSEKITYCNSYSVGANNYIPQEKLNRMPAEVAARYGLYRHSIIGCIGWESNLNDQLV